MSQLDVIGAGFGRTGTPSLQTAIERLGGGPCYHMVEVVDRPGHAEAWLAAAEGDPLDTALVFDGFRATVDWPGCRWWKELWAANPTSKVLLTRRPPGDWFESFSNTIVASLERPVSADVPPRTATMRAMARAVVWGQFGGEVRDRDHVLGVVAAHEAEVVATVPPEQLLVLEVADGWDPLCAFLGLPVPDEAFPRTNSTAEFRERSGLDV